MRIKSLSFLILLLLIPTFLSAKLNRKDADKVNFIFQKILKHQIKRKIIILKEDEINSYLYFYRDKIFEDDVKWVKIKFFRNSMGLRIVMYLNKSIDNSYLALLKGSIVDINSEFKIINIKDYCFKLELISLNINDFNLDKRFAISLLSSIAPDFKMYFEGFCPSYNIKKIKVREKEIALFF